MLGDRLKRFNGEEAAAGIVSLFGESVVAEAAVASLPRVRLSWDSSSFGSSLVPARQGVRVRVRVRVRGWGSCEKGGFEDFRHRYPDFRFYCEHPLQEVLCLYREVIHSTSGNDVLCLYIYIYI